ncbi:MAG: alpha/beta fold hydrolase [Sedimenticolaceae bacterium]
MTGLIRYILRAAGYSTLGASVVLVIVYVLYLNGRADLDVWHTAELDQEFTEGSGIETFGGYLELEERLFRQLDELVYAEVQSDQRSSINRYNRGSLSDPERWRPNWNRSFELPVKSPRAAVLLLHGMSDSPYSLRHLGEGLNAAGAYVLGLRMPGHGTAPSGLVEITWQDMAAAVRLAMRHLAEKGGDRPLYVVGYSAGAALAVQYALASIEDEALPQVDRLVLLSPAIGVTSMAALAVWQARLGHLLGLDKLAWNSILPEYDPFKYNSFAVNAGDVVYQLTNEIQERIGALEQADMLRNLPPILAFSSVVDATVSTPALIEGLFERLPSGGHELVLFDINRTADIDPIIKWDPARVMQAIDRDPDRVFTLSIVSNEAEDSSAVSLQTKYPDEDAASDTGLGISWPKDLYSLSHVALPFPSDDPVYGGLSPGKSPGIHFGDIALRGERGVLQISPAEMLRLRWNPFYAYVQTRVLELFGMNASAKVGGRL